LPLPLALFPPPSVTRNTASTLKSWLAFAVFWVSVLEVTFIRPSDGSAT
jgi:hypothetical protein